MDTYLVDRHGLAVAWGQCTIHGGGEGRADRKTGRKGV